MGTSFSLVDQLQKLDQITFTLQDTEYKVNTASLSPTTTLNSYIRNTLHMTGTKGMCFAGGCGSCLVVLVKVNPISKENETLAVNSCLLPILWCNGMKIYSVEGIGNPSNGYHPIQKVLAQFNGTQCGFCSPGMVMNMYALYQSGKLTAEKVENSFGGNLCRCTGYRSILSAFKSLSENPDLMYFGHHPDIEDLKICETNKNKTWDSVPVPAYFHQLASSKWIKVLSLHDLFSIINTNTNSVYKLIGGNTAKGVYPSYGDPADLYIDISHIQELTSAEIKNNDLVLGANITLTNLITVFEENANKNTEFGYLQILAEYLDLVANVPIRNVGTMAGNLMIKHDYHEFPSDIFLLLETIGATITVVDSQGSRTQLSPQDFINSDMHLKVLVNVTIPRYPVNVVQVVTYKIMQRAQNVHALVNAGFCFKLNNEGVVESAKIVYGNIHPTFVHAVQAERVLQGKKLFDNTTLQAVFEALSSEVLPTVKLPEPSPEFRRQLAIALFYKAVLNLASSSDVRPSYQSGGSLLERPISTGVEEYKTDTSLYPLTQPIPQIEALQQTSGQAHFVGDIPDLPHQLYGFFVLAEAPANSTIKSIDPSKALKIEGVEAFYDKSDIPGDNSFTPKIGLLLTSEEIFCSGRVKYYQQPVGLLVGKDEGILAQAALLIEITYETSDEEPLLSTRQILRLNRTERIKESASIPASRTGGNVKHIIKGSFDIYYQYHFHMETHCCNVVPTEDGLEIYPSSQWMDLIQAAVASMLKIPNNKIILKVRRVGGAFGAKVSRSSLISCAAALAAWKLRKPVKLRLPLELNMAAIGKRPPFSTDYEVGVDDDGIVQYLKCNQWTDLGWTRQDDPTTFSIPAFKEQYTSDTFKIKIYTVVTDTPVNTWARGPGYTEGLASIEAIMEHIAYSINLDPLDVKEKNFSLNSPLKKYVAELKSWANIDGRKVDIQKFNAENRWKKKGLAVVPMKFGLPPYGPFSVMISIFHRDGTVQIRHGGIEIGQGINTKACQVCAYKFGIALDKVSVVPSNNFVGANNIQSAGSVSSEAVCYGIIQACDELLNKMKPYKTSNDSWETVVAKCHENYVSLSAIGNYSPNAPGVLQYYVYGICATEILLDVLTGQHLIVRVDLIEDLGQSMSPLIDVGQIEGAFIMGLGYYTTEKIVYNYEGKVLTNNTWTYYPPGAKDIPVDFRIKFCDERTLPFGVLGSKSAAEPPLCMSVSVPLAIRNAVASARRDSSSLATQWYCFDGPSDVENTFMNSLNKYTQYTL